MTFEPLTDRECDDLFQQMQKSLDANNGAVPDKSLLACELENFFRLRQSVYQLRANVRGGDTAIRSLEQQCENLELLLKRVAAECRETFRDTDEMAPSWVALLADIDATIGYHPVEPASYDGLPEYLASPYTPRDAE